MPQGRRNRYERALDALHMHPITEKPTGTNRRISRQRQALLEIISLPIYPSMPDADVTIVCDTLIEIIKRNTRK